jgi:hypothetical protein
MTFEPHPREYFAQRSGDLSKAPARIANLRDKLESLEHAGVGQRLQHVAQVGDAGRRRRQVTAAAGEVFARMRLEGHHGGFDPEFDGGAAHVRQQCLVAAVDTVKVADREGAGCARPVVGKSAKYLHQWFQWRAGRSGAKYLIIR